MYCLSLMDESTDSDFDAASLSADEDRVERFFERRLSEVFHQYRKAIREVPTSPACLKEIASVSVAIALWNHVNIPLRLSVELSADYTKYSDGWRSLYKRVTKLVSELPIPYTLIKIIQSYISDMEHEMVDWVEYHHKRVFFDRKQDYTIFHHIHDIIWNPNGTINFKETAKNMTSSPRLNSLEKFRFLSTYCIKTEIETMAPLLVGKNVIDYVSFSTQPLLFYWNCHVKNELHKIRCTDGESLGSFMAKTKYVDNWYAKEYFFDQSSTEEQTQIAIDLIRNHGLMYQKQVLWKLNEVQKQLVYLSEAVNILLNYASVDSKDLLQTWFDVKNSISKEQFVEIIVDLLGRIPATILSDIWISASIQFRRYALNYKDHEIIVKSLTIFASTLFDSYDFLFSMMHDASVALKKEITRKATFDDFCDKLLSQDKLFELDQLLEVCFKKSHESAEYKKSLILKSAFLKKRCLEHYVNGDIKKLNDFLDVFLSSNSDLIANYKKEVLMSPEGIQKCAYHINLKKNTLDEIVNDSLPSPTDAAEFKKRLALSSTYKFRWFFRYVDLQVVENYVKKFFTSEEDEKTFKKLLLQDCQYFMCKMFKFHDEIWWQSFVMWCLGDEQSVKDFKREIPADQIFDKILIKCIFKTFDDELRLSYSYFRRDFGFAKLDRFLKWYYEKPDVIKKVKLDKIHNYENIDMIKMLLKKKDEKYLRATMTWFFNNDQVQIAKFKKIFKGEKITKMI